MSAALIWVAPASAQTSTPLPPAVEDNIDAVAEFYADQSGTADLGCGTACGQIKTDFLRAPTAPRDPVPTRLIKSFVDAGKSLVRSPWKLPLETLSASEGLLVGANVYVWKVKVFGAHPKDYFIKAPRAAVGISKIRSWVIMNGTDSGYYPTFFEKPNPLPVGIVAIADTNSAELWHTGTNPATGGPSRCNGVPPTTTPWGIDEYTWWWNRCWEGYYNNTETYSNMYAHGWKVSTDVLFDPQLDPPGRPDTPRTYTVQGNALTKDDIKQRLRDLLASNDPDYAVLRDWLCAALGGECRSPKDLYPHTPDCAGVTPAVCVQRFRDAGFTGDVTVKTLNSDDAIMEQPGGAVVDTEPRTDVDDVANRDITVYANPDEMPVMTAADTALATTLASQNDDGIERPFKTIARVCRRYVQQALHPESDCESLPILVPGDETRSTAINAAAALVRNPSWIALNARETSALIRTAWYKNRAEPAPGCLDAEKFPATAHCDEFPYWSTMQGYNGTLNDGTVPSIRWVPDRENVFQGQMIKQFYSTNQPGPTVRFRGCNVTKQDPAELVPLPESTYLNVPIPWVPTTAVCNDSP